MTMILVNYFIKLKKNEEIRKMAKRKKTNEIQKIDETKNEK